MQKSKNGEKPMSVGPIVLEAAIKSFEATKELAEKAIAQTTDEHLHLALDENTNSIAVIAKHVAGNLRSRWTDFLTTDGDKPWRNRDSEFVDTFKSRDEMLQFWEEGWQCLFDALKTLTEADLHKTVTIRDVPHSVPLAIDRSLWHTGYHVGQIVMLARFYAKENWTTLTLPRKKPSS